MIFITVQENAKKIIFATGFLHNYKTLYKYKSFCFSSKIFLKTKS